MGTNILIGVITILVIVFTVGIMAYKHEREVNEEKNEQ